MNNENIDINGESFNASEIANHSLIDFCEQYNGCVSPIGYLQRAWDQYEEKHGEIQLDDRIIMDLITASVKFGAESALIEVSDRL